jgi:hypothetical protein
MDGFVVIQQPGNSVSTEQAHGGKQSLQLTAVSADGTSAGNAMHRHFCNEGRTDLRGKTIEAWMYFDYASNAVVEPQCSIDATDNPNHGRGNPVDEYFGRTAFTLPLRRWTLIQSPIITEAAAARSVGILFSCFHTFQAAGTAQVYIDDVALR